MAPAGDPNDIAPADDNPILNMTQTVPDDKALIPADPCPGIPCVAGHDCHRQVTAEEPSNGWYVAPGGVVCP